MPLPQQDVATASLDAAASQFEASARLRQLGELDPDVQRINEWIIATEALALTEYRIPQILPGFIRLFVGIQSGPADESLVVLAFVRSGSPTPRQAVTSELVVPGTQYSQTIPLVVADWDLRLHQAANAAYGTRTCFVDGSGQDAFLTARHVVVETALGSYVDLEDGTVAPLLAHAPECLDASIAEAPGAGQTLLSTALPAANTTVDVHTKASATFRKIEKLSHSFGTTTAGVPHLFTLDRPLQSGDSGSLVTNQTNGLGVGLYVGELTTPGGPVGLCQGLYQLEALFLHASQMSQFSV